MRPWTAFRTVFALAIFIAASATYAAADPLTLVNFPISMSAGNPIDSVVFLDASIVAAVGDKKLHLVADGTTGLIGQAIAGTTIYNLYLDSTHTLLTKDYLFIDDGGGMIFNQNAGPDPVMTFVTDQAGISVEVTNSWLDLSGPIRKWLIPGQIGGGGSGGGSTWKFVDGGGEVAHNTQDMEFDFPPTTNSVPELSSLYLIAVGLGVGTKLLRRVRQSR